MYWIKFTTLRKKRCDNCKEVILHNYGNLLYSEGKTGYRKKVSEISQCIHCDKLLKINGKEVDVDYIEI